MVSETEMIGMLTNISIDQLSKDMPLKLNLYPSRILTLHPHGNTSKYREMKHCRVTYLRSRRS